MTEAATRTAEDPSRAVSTSLNVKEPRLRSGSANSSNSSVKPTVAPRQNRIPSKPAKAINPPTPSTPAAERKSPASASPFCHDVTRCPAARMSAVVWVRWAAIQVAARVATTNNRKKPMAVPLMSLVNAQCFANRVPQPGTASATPIWRRQCHIMALLLVTTGRPSSRSIASIAGRTRMLVQLMK